MFTLLESTGAKTLTELHNGRVKTALTAIKAFRDMSAEDQETASYLWGKLVNHRAAEIRSSPRPRQAKPPTKPVAGRVRISLFPLLLP